MPGGRGRVEDMTDMQYCPPYMPRTQAAAAHVEWLDCTDSTNAFAQRMVLGESLPSGLLDGRMMVIGADMQDAGHGRLGRTWVNRRGESLMCSLVTVVPRSLVDDDCLRGWLQMGVGLSVVQAIAATLEECGAKPYREDCDLLIKWPNDIYCHGLKMGGILSQVVALPYGYAAKRTAVAEDEGGDMVAVVFGVGLNVLMPADALPTTESTSLQLHRGPLPPFNELRDMVVARMVVLSGECVRALVESPDAAVASIGERTRAMCWTIGRRVDVALPDGSHVRGLARALDDAAALVVIDDQQVEHVISTGDVGVLPWA